MDSRGEGAGQRPRQAGIGTPGPAERPGRHPWGGGRRGRRPRGPAGPGRWSRGPPPSTRRAAAAAAAEPRKRAGISCARPASARWAAVAACRWLRGRRLRRSGGRRGGAGGAQEGGTGPRAKTTGVSGDGPEGVAAGGRDAWLPGAAGGARSPVGAGRKVDAASGSLPFPGIRPADILCPPVTPSPSFPSSPSASQAPAAVTRAQVTPWLLSLCLCPSSWKTCFLTSLPSLQPCLPLSDSLKSDPLQGHCDKKEGRSNLTPEQAPVLPTPHRPQGPGFFDRAPLVPVPLGYSFRYQGPFSVQQRWLQKLTYAGVPAPIIPQPPGM